MRFTLTVLPDGHMILSTAAEISPEAAKSIRSAWDQWKDTPQGLAIIADCTVQHAKSVEIELAVA